MNPLTSSFGLGPLREAALQKFGPRLDPELVAATRALFEGTWDLSLPAGGARSEDLAYGPHARHRIDLCSPGRPDRPILLFVHGGGFVGGDKKGYAHIGPCFARAGFLTAVMNYRLAPDHGWPAGAEDVSAALDWLAEHGKRHGGDPSRIFIVGQSAGAVHAGGALLDPRFRPRCCAAVRAALLLSGLHEIAADSDNAGVLAYFGRDPSLYPDRSPINHTAGSRVHMLLTLAELDPPFIIPSTLDMAKALAKRDGRAVPLTWLKGHNHVSPVLALGAPGDELGAAIAAAFAPYDAAED